MIGGIRGKIISKNPPEVIIDTGGVLYRVLIPILDFDEIGAVGASVLVHTHLYLKDNTIEIYGFLTEVERALFLDLTKVPGLGPKSALSILSQIRAEDLIRAINGEDLDRISAVKGVGRKKASKILIELKGMFVPEKGRNYIDALNALQALGLSVKEAKRRLTGIDESLPVEEIIKEALRHG
ncbi:MAG TPA: Holliday junction branch migration protein RuvA [bacterium (Candidatus Stahlbacteria)]|nr:Holliday junction branch migration protein RuvA [Candidatus Stahlbacteria bacterium]